MAKTVYTGGLRRHFDGSLTGGPIDWTQDTNISAALVSDAINYVDGTVDPDDGVYVADIFDGATAEEYNSSNYQRVSIPAADRSTNIDATNDEVECIYTGGGITWTNLDADTEGDQIAGVLIFKEGATDDTDAPVIALLDPSEAPIAGNGSDVTLTFTTEDTNQVVYKVTAQVG